MNKIKSFLNKNKWLLLILAGAILLRALFMIMIFQNAGDKGFYPHASEDAEQYFSLAKNMAERGLFSKDEAAPFQNELFRTPGYPFFISIFYRAIPFAWPAVVFQNLLALCVIVFIYKIAKLLFQKESIGFVAASFYAFEPAVVYWNSQLLSETLFTFLVICAVFIFLKDKLARGRLTFSTAMIIGALISFANYTRPVAQFVLVIFVIFGLFPEKNNWRNFLRQLAIVALMMASFAALSAPWIMRSKALMNNYDFSSASSEIGFKLKYLRPMYVNVGDDPAELDMLPANEVKAKTIRYIAKHPFAFLEVHISNAVPFLMGDSYFTAIGALYPPLERQRVIVETWFSSLGDIRQGFLNHRGAEGVIFFGGKIILLALNILALIGILAWLFAHKKNRFILIFLLAIIYYFILATGAAAYSRFRQPVNPYIFIFIAFGIDWLCSRKKLKSKDI